MNENTLKNCRILIKNIEDGEIIADTKIIRYNSLMNSVMISADSIAEKKYCKIQAYVFAKECLYAFNGAVKGTLVNNEIEVLLGKSSPKEDRKQTRYPIMLEGTVCDVYVADRLIRLRKPIQIQTVNISSGGILIKADAGCFDVGDRFSLLLKSRAVEMKVVCEIVRMQNCGRLTEEYGCRMAKALPDHKGEQEKKS